MTAHDDTTADTASLALAPPPAKRARLLLPVEPDALPAIFTPTICTSSPPPQQLSVSSTATDERVFSALSQGVLAFLSLADAAALVQTSRLLRSDAPHSIARLLPDFQRLFPDESSVVFRLPHDWSTRLANASAVVATAHFVQQRVAKWSFTYAPHRPNADDDLLCSVQPIVMPLALFRDDAAAATTAWSRSAIQQALNAFCAGGGDAFFDDKRAANGSRFAAHWDSIHVDRVTGRVACRLCATTQNALAQYKRQFETGLRQYELLLRCQEATWSRKTPAEREQLTKAFHAKCFKADAYLRPECAAWPDARLLRHIYEHGKLQAWSIGDTRARGITSVDALLRAVSFAYQHQCRTFYQPLKQKLHAKNHVVGRIPHATLPPTAETSDRVLTELVGGVDGATGIFSGVQVTFRLTP